MCDGAVPFRYVTASGDAMGMRVLVMAVRVAESQAGTAMEEDG
jgi:hypothetical protein